MKALHILAAAGLTLGLLVWAPTAHAQYGQNYNHSRTQSYDRAYVDSPRPNGLLDGRNPRLRVRLDSRSQANHVHVYVDGRKVGDGPPDSIRLSGLSRGRHQLEVRPATRDHREIGVKTRENFYVR